MALVLAALIGYHGFLMNGVFAIFLLLSSLGMVGAPPDLFGFTSTSGLRGERLDDGFELRAGQDRLWIGRPGERIQEGQDGGIVVHGEYLPRIRENRWGYPDEVVAGVNHGQLLLFRRDGTLQTPDEVLVEFERRAAAFDTTIQFPSNLARVEVSGNLPSGLILPLIERLASMESSLTNLHIVVKSAKEVLTVEEIGMIAMAGGTGFQPARIFLEIRFFPSREATAPRDVEIRHAGGGSLFVQSRGDRTFQLESSGVVLVNDPARGFLEWIGENISLAAPGASGAR